MAKNNSTLHNAKTEKNDEFYTRLEDINAEMRFYTEYFRGKTVFCNCDDPLVSNSVLYFGLNFHHLGLKRLIATCFRNEDPTRFSFGSKKNAHGTVLDYHGEIDEEDVADDFVKKLIPYTKPMKGNGDFRSEESLALLKEADIVVTNPPFSLFREFITTLEEYGKKYIVLGNLNAIACKEIFPLFKTNRLWWGVTTNGSNRWFRVPDSYEVKENCSGYKEENGHKYMFVNGIMWYTNINNKKRSEGVYLKKSYDPSAYPTYDNYDAIEVSKVADIPVDYDGVMGVPITFLDKYNPEQFEIVGQASGNSAVNNFAVEANYRKHPNDRGGCGIVNGERVYSRILIRRRPEWNQDEHF